MNTIIQLKDINKSFGDKTVLNKLNLHIETGEFLVISGPSGCGKSTLLNIIGLLDTADEGEYLLFSENAPRPFSSKAEKLLAQKIGYLFQNFALVDHKTVAYNLSIALVGVKREEREARISEVLTQVGLEGFESKKVYQCSGGEQQRIALARILLKKCELILCDEPTGSLDLQNKNAVIEILQELNHSGKTVVVVTHDSDVVEVASRQFQLHP